MNDSLASTIRAANAALISDGDLSAIGQFFSPDYLVHITGRDMEGGHDVVRSFLTTLRRAFPDVRIEVEVLVQGGDRVAWQRTWDGTQEGAFMGFPALGRRIVWRDMVTTRVSDGLIAEEWVITDLAERLLLARKATT